VERLEVAPWRGAGGRGRVGGVGGVLVPGPLHAVAAQVVAGGELTVGLGIEVGVALPGRPATRSMVAQPSSVHSLNSAPAGLRTQAADAVLRVLLYRRL